MLQDRLNQNYTESRRNRYYWELALCLHDFQTTAPKILLALKSSDTSDPELKKEGVQNVKAAIEEFQKSWKNLESLYSKTRFISYPVNYIPDRYFHLASQSEDFTWMIQPEKLYIGMIEKWIEAQK